MSVQTLFDILLGGAATFFLWALKENWRTLEKLKEADHALEVKIAEKYEELKHKLNGTDKFVMAHYIKKIDLEKMLDTQKATQEMLLSHINQRLDKSDKVMEKLSLKIDEIKSR